VVRHLRKGERKMSDNKPTRSAYLLMTQISLLSLLLGEKKKMIEEEFESLPTEEQVYANELEAREALIVGARAIRDHLAGAMDDVNGLLNNLGCGGRSGIQVKQEELTKISEAGG